MHNSRYVSEALLVCEVYHISLFILLNEPAFVLYAFVINFCACTATLRLVPKKKTDSLFVCRVGNFLERAVKFIRVNVPVADAVAPVCFDGIPACINPIIVNCFREPIGN